MSLTASQALLAATDTSALKNYRDYAEKLHGDRELEIDTNKLDTEGLNDLIAAAKAVGDSKTARAVESILLARAGQFDKPVPNFKAYKGVLEAFLKADSIDGWIFVTGDDGKLSPQLVTAVTYDDGMGYSRSKGNPSVRIQTTSYGFHRDGNCKVGIGVYQTAHSFSPQSVANRRLAVILSADRIYKETQAMRDAHMVSLERHHNVTQDAFAKQFRVSGADYHFEEGNHSRRGLELSGRRVIHDLEAKDYGAAQRDAESYIFNDDADAGGVGPVPEHPVVKVFDLRTHEWHHGRGHREEPADHLSAREALGLCAAAR